MITVELFTVFVSISLENHTPMFAERETSISPLSGTVKTTVGGDPEKQIILSRGEWGCFDMNEDDVEEIESELTSDSAVDPGLESVSTVSVLLVI